MRKSYRVKKEAEFQKVFTQGKSGANKQFDRVETAVEARL